MPMPKDHNEPEISRPVDKGLRYGEDIIYIVVAAILVVGAVALLFQTVLSLVTALDDGIDAAIELGLDRLLLIFILVELLGAVRAILTSRELVAEPFLLVGIIASIKEIVVITVTAKDDFGTAVFEDAMLEIAVLGVLVVLLTVAILFLRRKEREPSETS